MANMVRKLDGDTMSRIVEKLLGHVCPACGSDPSCFTLTAVEHVNRGSDDSDLTFLKSMTATCVCGLSIKTSPHPAERAENELCKLWMRISNDTSSNITESDMARLRHMRQYEKWLDEEHSKWGPFDSNAMQLHFSKSPFELIRGLLDLEDMVRSLDNRITNTESELEEYKRRMVAVSRNREDSRNEYIIRQGLVDVTGNPIQAGNMTYNELLEQLRVVGTQYNQEGLENAAIAVSGNVGKSVLDAISRIKDSFDEVGKSVAYAYGSLGDSDIRGAARLAEEEERRKANEIRAAENRKRGISRRRKSRR